MGTSCLWILYSLMLCDQEDNWLYFDIVANAFLYRMVRMIVGTLLRIGFGSLSFEAFGEFLSDQTHCKAGPAIAARGLSLTGVRY